MMRSKHVIWYLILIALVFSNSRVLIGNEPLKTWKAGVSRRVITPPDGLWMAGYAMRDRPAEGKYHDLYLKVLALEDGEGHRAVFVGADILGFTRAMSERICAAVVERHGLRREQIMLSASHTHCGPVLEGALYDIYPLDDSQKLLISDYTKRLEQWTVEAIGEALQTLRPARLEAFQGQATFAVNRRNNREADVPEIYARGETPQGPSNHRVPGFVLREENSDVLAVVFGYACHATVLGFYQWCGDYPGFAQRKLEEKFPGATALFFAGCGADQNALPRRSVELCQSYGEQLAESVLAAIRQGTTPISARLRTAFRTVNLEYELVDEATLTSLAAGEGYQARWARRLLAEREKGVVWDAHYPYPIQVWLLGQNQIWLALGGEVVVDYVNIFEKIVAPNVWVTAYANDVMAYIPSQRVWEEGGYEAGAFSVYGLPAVRWKPGIEQVIINTVQSLIDELRSQP